MSDKVTSRSDYLKLMYGDYSDMVSNLSSDNMNALGDSSIETLSTALNNRATNTIKSVEQQQDTATSEEKTSDRNWWQKIWDTADSVGLSLAEGLLSWFDDIWDFGVTTADAIAGGGNQWATDLKEYDWQGQVQKGANLLNVMHVFNGDAFTSDYWTKGWDSENARDTINDTLNNSYLNNMGEGTTEFVRGVENSIGYMIPSIVAAWLTGGGSLAAQGAQATMSSAASLATMGAGAFAGSTSDYYDENGGDYGRAVLGGVANAAVEVGTEMIFRGGGKVASNVLVRVGKEALEEGTEEVISGALDPIKDWIGGSKNGEDVKETYIGKDALDFWFKGNDSVLMQGVSGAVTGVVMGAPNTINDMVKYGNSGTVLKSELMNVREAAINLSETEDGSSEYVKAAKKYGDALNNFNEAWEKVKADGKLTAKQQENIGNLFTTAGIESTANATLNETIDQMAEEINSDGGERFFGRMKFSQLTDGLVGNMTLDYGKTSNGNVAEIKNGKVTIDFDQAKGNVAKVLVHEIVGHAWANEIVNDSKLSSLVNDIQETEWYKKNESTLRKDYITNNEEYSNLHKASPEQAENYWKREVVANYIEEMFSKPKSISKGLFGTTGLKALDRLLGRGIFNKAFENQKAAKSFIELINNFTKRYANPIYNALVKYSNGEELNAKESHFLEEYENLFPIYEDYAKVTAFAKKVNEVAEEINNIKETPEDMARKSINNAKGKEAVSKETGFSDVNFDDPTIKRAKKGVPFSKYDDEAGFNLTCKVLNGLAFDLNGEMDSDNLYFSAKKLIEHNALNNAIDELETLKDELQDGTFDHSDFKRALGIYQYLTSFDGMDAIQNLIGELQDDYSGADHPLSSEMNDELNEIGNNLEEQVDDFQSNFIDYCDEIGFNIDNLSFEDDIETQRKENGTEVQDNSGVQRSVGEGNQKQSSSLWSLQGTDFKDIGQDSSVLASELLQQELDSGTSGERLGVIKDSDGVEYLVNAPNFTYSKLQELFKTLPADIKQMLSEHSLEDFKNAKLTLMSVDGTATLTVTADGDIINALNIGKTRGFIKKALLLATKNGGVKMDCYNIPLSDNNFVNLPYLYSQLGFEPISRTPYNAEFVDETIREGFTKKNNGEQITFMKFVGESKPIYETYEQCQEAVHKTPSFSEWDDAMQFRDNKAQNNVKEETKRISTSDIGGLPEEQLIGKEKGELKFNESAINKNEVATTTNNAVELSKTRENANTTADDVYDRDIGGQTSINIEGEEIKVADYDSAELIRKIANERINGKVVTKATVEKILKAMEVRMAQDSAYYNFKISGKSEFIQTIYKAFNLTDGKNTKATITKAVNQIFSMDLGGGYTFGNFLDEQGKLKTIRDQWVRDFQTLLYTQSKDSTASRVYENALNRVSTALLEARKIYQNSKMTIKFIKMINAKVNAVKNATKVNTSGKTGKYVGLETTGATALSNFFRDIKSSVADNGVTYKAIQAVSKYYNSDNLEYAINALLSQGYDFTTDDLGKAAGDPKELAKIIDGQLDVIDLERKENLLQLAQEISEIEAKGRRLNAYEVSKLGELVKGIWKLYTETSAETKAMAKHNAEPYREAAKRTAEMMRKDPSIIKSMKALQGVGLDFANPKLLVSMVFGGTYEGSMGEKAWRKYFRDPYSEQLKKQIEFETRVNEITEPLNKSSVQKISFEDKYGAKVKANRYVLYNYYLNTLAPDNVTRMKANNNTVEFYDGHVNHTIETSTLDDMLTSLTIEEKSVLDSLFNFYNNELKTYSTATQIKNYGFAITRDNYYPINVSDASRAVTMTQDSSQTTLSAMSNARMKQARNVQSKIEINRDPRMVAQSYIEQMTISGEVGKISREFGQILNFKDNDGYSTRMYASEYIDKAKERITYLQQAIIAKRDQFFKNNVYSKVFGKWSTATLGLNLRSALKQFASFFTAWNKTSVMSGLKGLGVAFSKKSTDYINNNNPIFQYRVMEDGIIRASTLSNGAAQFTSTTVRKLVEKSLSIMETFDKWTCYMSFGAAQYEVERLYGYKVGTQENLEAANDLFTDMILETQSNSDRIAISQIRSGAKGEVSKYLFGMFASDSQNKFTLAIENVWNRKMLGYELGVAEMSGDLSRVTYLKGEITKTNKGFVKIAGTLLAAGLWEFLANMIIDWLYDKKDFDEVELSEALVETAKNSFLDWIPVLGNFTNWFDYGEVSIGATTYFENIIDCMQTVKLSGWSTATFMSIGTALAEACGIPAGNVKNLVNGVISRITSNFSPKTAVQLRTILYGTSESYLTGEINDYAKAGKTKKASGYVSQYYSLYKFSISDEVALEIADIKSSGTSVSVHSRLTEVDGETLTDEQQTAFDTIYNQTGDAISKATNYATYQTLNSSEKAYAIKKISDAFYNVAKSKVDKSTPSGRMAKLLNCGVDITKYAVYMARLSNLEGKTEIVSNINKMAGLSRNEKLMLCWLMGYSIDESTFKRIGLKSSQISALLA